MSRFHATSWVLSALVAAVATNALAADIGGTVTEAGTGKPLDGFVVSFANAPGASRATVGEDGSFLVKDAPAATTELLVFSATGAFFGAATPVAGRATISVEPTGHVYVSDTGDPAVGVRVRLLAGGAPTAALPAGQQDQVTDKHGLYRFDPTAAGTYTLAVEVDGATYHFPSTRVPPLTGVAVVDPKTGWVDPAAAPDAAAPKAFFLTFAAAKAGPLPAHNHVAVDRGGALVLLEKTATKTQAVVGDIITYTLRVENRSGKDFLRAGGIGGVLIRDVLPAEVRLVGESPRATIDGVSVNLAEPGGPSVLTFQLAATPTARAFELKRKSRIVIRYQVVVGTQARAGTVTENRAQVVDPGGVALSDLARVPLRFVGDAIFDLSWVRGRVFCDEDGDGFPGPAEPGIPAARVYVDTGRYAITDRDGRYHLSDLTPGLHLVKIDTNTVPPDSPATGETARQLHVSRGIPQQVSFGFRCSTAPVGPSSLVPRQVAPPPEALQRVVVTGMVSELGVSLDGKPVGAKVTATLGLRGAVTGDVLLDRALSPQGFREALTFEPKLVPGTLGTASLWRVWIEAQGGQSPWLPLRVFSGKGAPPPTLEWDGKSGDGKRVVAKRGQLHRAWLEVTDGLGSRWKSPLVHFSVGQLESEPTSVLSRPGPLLDAKRKVVGAVRTFLDKAGKTGKGQPWEAVLSVALAGKPTAADRAAAELSLKALADRLATQAKIARARVSTELTAAATPSVTVTWSNPGAPPRAGAKPMTLPKTTLKPEVRVLGQLAPLDDKGRFVVATAPPVDGLVVVELRAATGATRELLVSLAKTDAAPGEAPLGLQVLTEALKRKREGKGPPEPLAVAGLEATLPPDGALLGQPLLPIVGRVPDVEGLTVTVNGQLAPLDHGAFEVTLPLPNGEETPVVIEAKDAAGNVARIERKYRVKGNALFLLVLADGALAQPGTQLDGLTDQTTLEIKAKDKPLLLHGRAALYLKARVKGGDVIKNLGFTAFVDTARKAETVGFLEQVIDPNRSYPMFGDGATEGSDARTHGKYYVAIEADRSKLIVGTFKTSIGAGELFRYERVTEGAQVRLDHAFAPGYHTVVEAFVGYGDKKIRHRQAVLKATGGSYYFLPDKEIVEGTEVLRIAIYDRDTGGLLLAKPQVRNADYTIDYVSGRVVFKGPLSSTVDASFLMASADALTPRLALGGHEVRIDVSYDTRALGGVGDVSFGAYGRQEIAGYVTVGGGYTREGRANAPDHELYGAELTVTPTRSQRTVIEAELAHSKSTQGARFLSQDGGLSFQSIGSQPADDKSGFGINVRARTDVGEFVGKDEPWIVLSASYRRQDAGFTSVNTTLEQGTHRGGAEVAWHIDRDNRLVLRHDTLKALTDDLTFSDGTRHHLRALTSAQYTNRTGRFTIVGEATHAFESNRVNPDNINRGGVGALLKYQVTDRVGLFLSQQFQIGGDTIAYRSTLDGFVTGVGIDIDLGGDLGFTIGEQIRWSGEDALVLGFRSKLSGTASMYVQQRLMHSRDTGRWVPATVMGSEERWGEDGQGRSYGEYQLGAAGSGTFNRAVLGVGRRFQVAPGFHADVGFERSHSTVVDGKGLTRDANALSLGGEWVGSKSVKFTTRLEGRFEQSDFERFQIVALNRLAWDFGKGFSLLGRADVMVTQNRDLGLREAESMELSLGFAYRPMDDTFTLLVKAGRVVAMRPIGVDPAEGSLRTTADVVAIEPIFELPWGFQLTPKFAYRHAVEEAEGTSEKTRSNTLLAALRAAFHLWRTLDVAAEYRFMKVDLAEQMEHGALAELAVNILGYARIGAGYNFSHFSDDLFDVMTKNAHGFFVRVAGMY